MTYIYVATRIITYFGTETRVFLEQLICRILGIPQEDTRSFKASEMCGHVEHELATGLKQAFLLCFFPFTVNFILGCCILLTGAYRVFYIGDYTFSSILFALKNKVFLSFIGFTRTQKSPSLLPAYISVNIWSPQKAVFSGVVPR